MSSEQDREAFILIHAIESVLSEALLCSEELSTEYKRGQLAEALAILMDFPNIHTDFMVGELLKETIIRDIAEILNIYKGSSLINIGLSTAFLNSTRYL